MSQVYIGNGSGGGGPSTDLHVARFIVSAGGTTDGANYTTLAAAYAAAVSAGGNQTVFLQPGTYTENLTLVAGINLSAFDCDSQTPNVTLLGKITATFSGSASISGINLKTNGDFCLAVTGSAATQITLSDCNIDANNNTAISFTSSSSSSLIKLFNCTGDIDTTGITYFAHSGAGAMTFTGGYFRNDGNTTTASTLSGDGQLNFYNNLFSAPITTTGTNSVLTIVNCQMYSPIIVGGTDTNNQIDESSILTGSSSAISVSMGATLILANCTIDSTNTNAITGSGTIKLAGITFTNTSSTVNTSTVVSLPFLPNASANTAVFSVALSANQNDVTGDGLSPYQIPYDSKIIDTQNGSSSNNYSTSTFLYTFPYTGQYQINVQDFVFTSSGTATSTQMLGYALVNGSINIRLFDNNPLSLGLAASGEFITSCSFIYNATAGDTMGIYISLNGGTKNIGAAGNPQPCTFSGFLIP